MAEVKFTEVCTLGIDPFNLQRRVQIWICKQTIHRIPSHIQWSGKFNWKNSSDYKPL